jgi:type I restriction enzyme, S subunit
VNVVSRRAALNAARTLRLDPEYFQKQHLDDAELVGAKNGRFVTFKDLNIVVDASAFYPAIEEFYGRGDLPFLRVGDVDGFVDTDQCGTIPSDLCLRYPTLARVEPGDIVFTKGGAIDRVGLVTRCAAASRDLIFLKTSILGSDWSKFLFAYFSSEFFKRTLLRSSSQTAQPHLTITLVRELPILRSTLSLRRSVAQTVERALAAKAEAWEQSIKSEEQLTLALGLAGWSPLEPLSYLTSTTAVRSAGRLDAEYFAPRIRELLARLGSRHLTLGDVAPARRERFDATEPGDFDYIEIGDLSDGTASSAKLVRAEAPSRAAWHVHPGDVITSTVRPIRRLSALIEYNQDGFVCSSGFLMLQPQRVRPEVLLTYLRLPVFCELMDLHTSASMYPAVSEKDLLSLPYAPPDEMTEKTICSAVAMARATRRRAAELLGTAKRAVEIAIEQDETAAFRFLRPKH